MGETGGNRDNCGERRHWVYYRKQQIPTLVAELVRTQPPSNEPKGSNGVLKEDGEKDLTDKLRQSYALLFKVASRNFQFNLTRDFSEDVRMKQ